LAPLKAPPYVAIYSRSPSPSDDSRAVGKNLREAGILRLARRPYRYGIDTGMNGRKILRDDVKWADKIGANFDVSVWP